LNDDLLGFVPEDVLKVRSVGYVEGILVDDLDVLNRPEELVGPLER